jgi:signal peptidase II
MQKVAPWGKGHNVVFFLTALLVLVADQLTKIWIRANLAIGQSIPESGLFQLTHVYNTGAIFGFFRGQTFPIIIVGLVVLVLLLVFVFLFLPRFAFSNHWLSYLSLGLVFGGMAGNLIDRLRLGYVTDFIDIGMWPAFNIADSAITTGSILFAFGVLVLTKPGRDGQGRGW